MSTVPEKDYVKILKIFGIIIIIGILGWVLFINLYYNFGSIKQVEEKESIDFQECEQYIFKPEDDFSYKIDKILHKKTLNKIEAKCNKKYPNKRDFIIEEKTDKKSFTIPEVRTQREKIELPDNVVLEKSTIDIEIKIPKPNITHDVTFFGFSVGKVQNKSTIRIGAIDRNILLKKYTLEEVYEGENTIDFILTNLKGNDIEVNYVMNYYIKY